MDNIKSCGEFNVTNYIDYAHMEQFCDISECSIRVCKYSLHGFH